MGKEEKEEAWDRRDRGTFLIGRIGHKNRWWGVFQKAREKKKERQYIESNIYGFIARLNEYMTNPTERLPQFVYRRI
jgi:hypothetical protein